MMSSSNDPAATLVTTSHAMNIAVNGRGFLAVTNAEDPRSDLTRDDVYLTTTGFFRTDPEGYLRNDAGMALLGWPIDALNDRQEDWQHIDSLEPVVVDLFDVPGRATTYIKLGLNLPATETASDASGDHLPLRVPYINQFGLSDSLDFVFTPDVPTEPGLSNTWSLVITDSAQAGATVGAFELVFDNTRQNGGQLASVTRLDGKERSEHDEFITVNAAHGPIEIHVGRFGVGTALTQLSDTFAPVSISQNGNPTRM